MRKLLYVPIVHDEADMGSARADLAGRGAAQWGPDRWALHQDAVGRFWESIRSYVSTLDPDRLRIYQDGLAADGEIGVRIVNEAASRGSRNYRIVQELLRKGAQIRQTEDPVLLWQERESLLAQIRRMHGDERTPDLRDLPEVKDQLLAARDSFIAGAINTTLKAGELGLLFMGAYHDVAGRLATDISVEMLKDREKLRLYYRELTLGSGEAGLRNLAQYLASPVVRLAGC